MHRHHNTAHAPERAYVSEFTRFMESYMDKHPAERRKQLEGWRLLWDKKVDLEAQSERESSELTTPGYYYYDSPDSGH